MATAFAEDIIALILLSELKALSNPTAVNLITPIGVSLGYAIAVGAAAIWALPCAPSPSLPWGVCACVHALMQMHACVRV